jgi:hypothetical protein
MVCGNGDGSRRIQVSRRNRVKAALRERMAPSHAPQRQPRALQDAEPSQRHIRILRARRQVHALAQAEGMKNRRHHRLVKPICDANGESRLRVGHFTFKLTFKRHVRAAATVSPAASPQPSGSPGRHSQPRAPAQENPGRSRSAEDAGRHRPASPGPGDSSGQPRASAV